MAPICVALAFLPGPVWLRVAVPGLALIRECRHGARRWRTTSARPGSKQHGLEVPNDADLGPPH